MAGRPKGIQGFAPAFTKPQIQSVLAVAKSGRNGLRNHAYLQLLLSSAMRCSEPLALTRSMVTGADGSVVENATLPASASKSKRNRLLFLNRSCRKALTEYLTILPAGADTRLFDFTPNYASWLCSNLCSKANLPKHTGHSFRRTALQNLQDAGLQIQQLQLVSDHRNVNTLVTYLNRCPLQVQETIAKISY